MATPPGFGATAQDWQQFYTQSLNENTISTLTNFANSISAQNQTVANLAQDLLSDKSSLSSIKNTVEGLVSSAQANSQNQIDAAQKSVASPASNSNFIVIGVLILAGLYWWKKVKK